MSVRFPLVLLLGVILTTAIALGCGSAPAAQTTESASASQASVSAPTTKAVEIAPTSKAIERPATVKTTESPTTVKTTESAPVSQPTAAAAAAKVEPQTDTAEVGYEVGMRAPDFGMSLLDGTKVTSSDLANEGKPVFLYFHATF